jgi:hypothetical protein
MTAKISKSKLIAGGVALIAVIALIIALATSGSGGAKALEQLPLGQTNDERVAFLATYGWSVNADPVQTQRTKIPAITDNEVFARYNELQISQGFDLSGFAGKEAARYVYEVLNYPNATDPVYATVLVYEGHIIGGDVTNTAPTGVIHGFEMPGSLPEEVPSEATEPSGSTEGGEPTEPTEAPSEGAEPETLPGEVESSEPVTPSEDPTE